MLLEMGFVPSRCRGRISSLSEILGNVPEHLGKFILCCDAGSNLNHSQLKICSLGSPTFPNICAQSRSSAQLGPSTKPCTALLCALSLEDFLRLLTDSFDVLIRQELF